MSQTKESKDPKDAPVAKDAAKDGKGGKPRVYSMASELNVDTKTVLEYCKDLGYTSITSQLKSLEPEQVDALRERHKNGRKTAPKPAVAAKPAALPKVESKMPTLAPPKPKPPVARPAPALTEEPAPVEVVAPVAQAEVVVPEVVAEAAVEVPEVVTPKPAATLPKVAAKMPNLGRPQNLNAPKPKAALTETPAPVEAPAPIEAPAVEAVQPVADVAVEAATPAVVAPVEAPVATPAAVAEPAAPVAAPAVKPDSFQPAATTRPPTVLPPANPGMRTLAPVGRPASPQGTPQYLPPRPQPVPRPPVTVNAPSPQPANAGGGLPPRPVSTPVNAAPPASGRTPPNPGPPRIPGAAPRFGPQGSTAPQAPRPAFGPPGAPGARPPLGSPPPGGPNAPKAPMKLTLEQIQRLRQLEQQKGRVKIEDVHRLTTTPVPGTEENRPTGPNVPGRPGAPLPGRDQPGEGNSDPRRPGAPGAPGPGGAAGRDQRQKQRQERGRDVRAGSFRNSVVIGRGGSVDMITNDRHRKKHRGPSHVKHGPIVLAGKVEIDVPITVRNLSTTIGMKVGELILKLKNATNSLYTMNSPVAFDVAEMVAIDKGIELVAKASETAEDEVLRKLRETAEASDSANTTLRPPVVTIMGHVDHGKTSLLDAIRATYGLESDVVSTETGGITQVLRAWRVEKDGKSTTFLDTPGHEAFTKMRARGANVTDIAVIVVSAVDGIMPQTQEAVAHAKAAEVDIIVAINKCDLPGAQPDKVKARLFDMELVPEDLGGDVPVIYTSAITGQGIGELLDSIALLAEVAELKADPTLAGSGTCLEAYMEEDRGVVATFLVQNGTVRRGDTVLCGSTYGRVRAIYDDLAQPIKEAGPSTPIKIIGLNAVPDADDPFYVVNDLATAREIAGNRQDTRQEFDRNKFTPVSLDSLKEQSGKAKVSELKIILKAEARGSVEAIRKELEKLTHEEVRVRVLHAGIGAINESDVTLALTSPLDTIIVGFNVTSDDPAMRLAENREIKVQEYQIIYNLVDDVKAALEGRLKPIEEVVHLGRAIVRNTFKITKTGTIAGCYVTSGTVERSARIRVIRDGVVLYPQNDKVATLESLKRFKDDAKEVREGFECGLRIAGFDDIKVGDVIEAFKIEIKLRTL